MRARGRRLGRTTRRSLLPVLKQAGVVDAGGKGLFYIMEGTLRHIHGQPLDTPLATVQPLSSLNFDNAMQEVEEGQDYEVVVDFFPNSSSSCDKFYSQLEEMGTSIQVGEGEGMYRMHIHVPLDKRYEPVDYIMGIGTITKVAMENLVAQMDDIDARGQGHETGTGEGGTGSDRRGGGFARALG